MNPSQNELKKSKKTSSAPSDSASFLLIDQEAFYNLRACVTCDMGLVTGASVTRRRLINPLTFTCTETKNKTERHKIINIDKNFTWGLVD